MVVVPGFLRDLLAEHLAHELRAVAAGLRRMSEAI